MYSIHLHLELFLIVLMFVRDIFLQNKKTKYIIVYVIRKSVTRRDARTNQSVMNLGANCFEKTYRS